MSVYMIEEFRRVNAYETERNLLNDGTTKGYSPSVKTVSLICYHKTTEAKFPRKAQLL